MIYFVKDKNGKRGHPTKKGHMITRKLKNSTAKIISRTKDSLTVKLLDKEFRDEDTVDAEFRIGIDPGTDYVGISLYKIYNDTITLLISGEAKIRSTEVTKNLAERKMYRQNRRQCRRKNVKRKYGSCKFRKPIWKNRDCKPFRPTHNHLIATHDNLIKWSDKRCPINKIHIEYTKFDTQKINNPGIHSWQYQRGESYGFENVKSYVRSRDNYICQACKAKKNIILEVHHIIPKSNGGTNKVSNLITLCSNCHKKVHNNLIKCPSINNKNLKQSGILNSCMPKLFNIFEDRSPTQDTYGYITKKVRFDSGLEKTHEQDAQIIAFCDSLALQDISDYNYIDLDNHIDIKQYRRHNRSWVSSLKSRKYYIVGKGKKIFAYNRSRSTGQKKRGLDELKQILRSKNILNKVQIYATSGGPTYKRPNKEYPIWSGDMVKYNNNIHICKCVQNYGTVLNLEGVSGTVGIKKCKLIRKNSGLVFV